MAAAAILYAAAILLFLRKKSEGEWLAREDTTAMRGIMAVYVLLAHMPGVYSYLNESYAETFESFVLQGHLAVGTFLALSGFGLAVSAKKGFSGFFKRRFLGLLVPYFVCSLVFLIAFRAEGTPVSPADMIRSWFTGEPLVTYSWYVITQMIFYVFFYISFRFFGDRRAKIAVIFLLVLGYMLLMPLVGWPLVTVRGCFSFVFGALLGSYREEANAFMARGRTGLLTAVVGTAFLFSHIIYFAVPFFKDYPIFDLSGLLFAAFVFLMDRFYALRPSFFHLLGKYSLEIYLYQGLAFTAAKQLLLRLNMKNAFVYACLSLFLALAGAFAVHFLYERFRKSVVKFSIFKGKSD